MMLAFFSGCSVSALMTVGAALMCWACTRAARAWVRNDGECDGSLMMARNASANALGWWLSVVMISRMMDSSVVAGKSLAKSGLK